MDVELKDLIGKTLTEIINNKVDSIKFICNDGSEYIMEHDQDCCESVSVEDVVGDLTDLIDSPILIAKEDVSSQDPEGINKGNRDSCTWTFYNIATIKGHVTIRWYGESNGYYSEAVSFKRIKQVKL